MSGWKAGTVGRIGGIFLTAAVLAACSSGDTDNSAADTGGTRHATGAGALLQQQEETGQSSVIQEGSNNLLGEPLLRDSINIEELGFDRGEPEAAVRILEFSDFGCGYCRKFHMEIMETLNAEYMEQGTVLWKQIPFVMGNWANSVPASMGAECARAQGEFSDMSHALYQRQSDWRDVSAREADLAVRDIAVNTGADMDTWDACMATDDELWRVQAHTQLAREVGVRSTPTFFVVGYTPIQGALPIELFREVIDTVLVLEGAKAGG
jgi:protein-disulfide isomerase